LSSGKQGKKEVKGLAQVRVKGGRMEVSEFCQRAWRTGWRCSSASRPAGTVLSALRVEKVCGPCIRQCQADNKAPDLPWRPSTRINPVWTMLPSLKLVHLPLQLDEGDKRTWLLLPPTQKLSLSTLLGDLPDSKASLPVSTKRSLPMISISTPPVSLGPGPRGQVTMTLSWMRNPTSAVHPTFNSLLDHTTTRMKLSRPL
jgi:hypothetical protein